MITPEKIEELRRLAERAQKGEWSSVDISEHGACITATKDGYTGDVSTYTFQDDAYYIVAAQPQNVLALLDHIAELEAERNRLSDELQSARRYIEGRWRVDD